LFITWAVLRAILPRERWVFPLFWRHLFRCHHGGAGTTAAGFAAGVPSIIVPFSNDQFAWAHRAYELGPLMTWDQ